MRRRVTYEITISDAKLVVDSMGSFLDNLFPGGSDLRHVKMSNELLNYFPTVRRELCTEDSLWSFPEVALARLFSLKISKEDAFLLVVFGYIMARDVSMTHNSMKAVRLHGKDMDVRKPRDDRWMPVLTINALRVVPL